MRFLILFIFFYYYNFNPVFGQRKQIKNYYDSEQKNVKELYHTIQNDTSVLDGLYKTYYQDGKVKTVGFYTKSQATDYWEYFYQNGNLKMEGIINNFLNQGHWIFYYENGNKSMEGNMDKGKKNGFWRFYNEDGSIKSEGIIQNDKNEGVWKYFNEEGNTKATALYKKGSGTYTEFYPNNIIKMFGKIKNGKSDSTWTYYYPNGSIKSKGIENNGLKEYFWKFYFENNSLASEGEYKNGKKIGIWKYYFENGNLKAQGNEKDGVKDGFWQMFYEDGKLKAEANYDKGSGNYQEYYTSGRLKAKGNILNGKYDGKWHFYLENELFKDGECIYSNGEGWFTGFYPDGKKKTEGMLRDGNKVGVWRLFKKDGTLGGFYKTSESEDEPITLSTPNQKQQPTQMPENQTIKLVEKPKNKKKNIFQKLHLYRPDPNIYKTFILSTDPIQFLSGGIPIFIEYYVQEKWGLEINITYFKNPFFKNHSNLPNRQVYADGLGYGIKYKRYFNNKEFIGRPYIAGEYRYRNTKYATNYLDTSVISQNTILKVTENSHEIVLIFGDRFMKNFNKGGPTLDIYMGIGAGYKINEPNYKIDSDKNVIFSEILKNNWYVPFRFGIAIGWAF